MIIIINGSINSGKTTVAKLLSEKIGDTAHIEVDKLREFIDFMPLDKEVINLCLINAALITKTFVDNNLNVIITYPLTKENYDFLIKELNKLNTKIYTFTLSPDLDKVLKNRGERKLSNWERDRIKHHYDIGIHKPEFESIIINNTNQTPEETAQEILKQINN